MADVNEGQLLVVAVLEKQVYGNALFYPNNEVAESFCRIAGKKTLTDDDLYLLDASPYYVVKSESYSASPWGA
jgi:hypothetical protein|tara:strand:+ start:880 stop:1098 length:219 start_codon:yes stop_codon:yes gene_type:complete